LLFTIGVAGTVPLLGEIDPESAAGRAGLKQGQEILQVDGEQTPTWADVIMQLFGRIGETGTIDFTVREKGSYDTKNTYQVEIVKWLSDEENPYPTNDLGLFLNHPPIPAIIAGVVEGSAAEKAGLKVNDEVVALNGQPIADWQDFVTSLQPIPGEEIVLSVMRDNQTVELNTVLGSIERDGKMVGFLGASRLPVELPADMQRTTSYPIYSALIHAVKKTWSVTVFTLQSIKKMIQGAISPKNLSGPITIAQVASATAQSGAESFISFIALLSISLGVINLLPIPMLDGGHLLYYLVELVIRRPVPERIQMWGLQMGMFLLVSMMLLAFYNDLMRL